jgi:hypothetical protein
MKIIESNTLIAKFMGGVLSTVPNLINLPQTRGEANIHSVKGSEVLPNGTYSVHRLNELEYHKCWNSLMLVVEKIESLVDEKGCAIYNVVIEQCFVEIIENHTSDEIVKLDRDNKRDVIYDAVVEFIKYYNENN